MNKKRVLHVGCGPKHPKALHPAFQQPEWIEVRLDINPAVEPDIINSITNMHGVANDSFHAIWSSHNLEHLFAHEVPVALGEFFRVLKPGGFALIQLPDIQAIAREVAKGNLEEELYRSPAGPICSIDVMWGFRSAIAVGNHYMAHKTGFTQETLQRKLMEAGFAGVQIQLQGYDLVAVSYKKNGNRKSDTRNTSNPDNPEYFSCEGDALKNRSALNDSTLSDHNAFRLNPESAEAYYNMGNTFHGSNNFEKATACYEKALKLQPDLVVAHYNLGNTLLDQKRFANAISSYQNTLALKPDYPEAHYNMGIAFFEQGRYDEARSCYQRAIKLNSNLIEAHYNLGIIFQEQGALDQAIACYKKALKLKPDFAEAYNNMGNAFKEQNDSQQAILCYQNAILARPDYADAGYNLGRTLHEQNKFDRAITCYQNALKIRPDYFKACNNLAKAFQDTGDIGNAIRWYRKALELKPDYAGAHFNLATASLLVGNFAEGWQEYEWRFKRPQWKKTYPYRFDTPRWSGESFTGKRLYVHSEQGLGDILQFVRYLPMVKVRGGTVIFETIKPLVKLLQNFDGVDELVEVADRDHVDPIDYYVPLLSLPGIFQSKPDTIPATVPYLFADDNKVRQWKARLSENGFKVGIVWAGTITDPERSLPLAWFTPISQIPGLHLYGLQKGISAEQIEVEGLPDGMTITNFGQEFDDFSDTAAVIKNLDLVISIDTSVAHLAGGMGKPVWLLLPYVPDWRWLLNREDSPWYPTMRLFRQEKFGEWESVIRRITAELRQF